MDSEFPPNDKRHVKELIDHIAHLEDAQVSEIALEIIKWPLVNLTVGELSMLNGVIHKRLDELNNEGKGYTLNSAFHASSMVGSGLYQWMRDNDDWS